MSKPEKATAKKVVLIVGYDLRESLEKVLYKDSEEVLLIGDGTHEISGFEKIIGQTDENTLFIVWLHGGKRPGKNTHYSNGGLETRLFLQVLQAQVGHKITVELMSCYGGALLKGQGVVGDNISVLTAAGSKYETTDMQNIKLTNRSILHKLSGKTNEEILATTIGSSPDSMYYAPFESNKSNISTAKFNLSEIEKILREAYEAMYEESSENIDKIIAEDLKKFPEIKDDQQEGFNLTQIKEILGLQNQDLDKEQEEKNSTSEKFKNDLIKRFSKDLLRKTGVSNKLHTTKYKFSRPGKFDLSEIEEILRTVYQGRVGIPSEKIDEIIAENIDKIIEGKKGVNFDMAIGRIKKALELRGLLQI